MNRETATRKQVTVFREGVKTVTADLVVLETPLTIFINGEELVTLLCTPQKVDRLALGFLRSEGLLKSYDQVEGLSIKEKEGRIKVELTGKIDPLEKLYGQRRGLPGRGRGGISYGALKAPAGAAVKSGVKFSRRRIWDLVRLVCDQAALFRATGGVHGAALVDHSRVLFFYEDIGRRNAVDKIAGEILIGDITLEDKALITTGRVSSEILLKSAMLSLPLLISRSAPTALAVELAERLNITLVGFARGFRMCVYAHPWRIV